MPESDGRESPIRGFAEFALFVQAASGTSNEVRPETDLVHDLGIAGIDGQRFAQALQQRYGLRLSDDEIIATFGPEQAITPWQLFLWLFGRAKWGRPLLAGDLYNRIVRIGEGKLSEPL